MTEEKKTGKSDEPTLPSAPGAEPPADLADVPTTPLREAGKGSVYATSQWNGMTKYSCPSCGFDTLNGRSMDDYVKGCLRDDCPYAGRKQELMRNV